MRKLYVLLVLDFVGVLILFIWFFTQHIPIKITLVDAHGQSLPVIPHLHIRLWSGSADPVFRTDQDHIITVSHTALINTFHLKRGQRYNLAIWVGEGDSDAEYHTIAKRLDTHILYFTHIFTDGWGKNLHIKLENITQKTTIRVTPYYSNRETPIPDNEVIIELNLLP